MVTKSNPLGLVASDDHWLHVTFLGIEQVVCIGAHEVSSMYVV